MWSAVAVNTLLMRPIAFALVASSSLAAVWAGIFAAAARWAGSLFPADDVDVHRDRHPLVDGGGPERVVVA